MKLRRMNPGQILALALFIIATGFVVEGKNICEKCVCDDLTPYLIDCSQQKLLEVFEEEDWIETLTVKNISNDTQLDVRFDDNKITRVKRFPQLNIVNLSFQKNSIQNVDNSAFADLRNLKSLDLSHNQLTADSLPELALYGIFNSSNYYYPLPVIHLSLSHNNIHR